MTRTIRRRIGTLCGLLPGLVLAVGCVERTVTITTEPDGATVMLNDQEVGSSPVTVPFTWYGDYDVICRKAGYRTLKTNVNMKAPWYQTPGLDLVSECMVPFTIRDRRAFDLKLEPESLPGKDQLLQRATEMKAEAAGPVD